MKVYICLWVLVVLEAGVLFQGVYTQQRHEAPYFRKKIPNLIQEDKGKILKLKCPIAGVPTPNTTWFKNNVPLNVSSRKMEIENLSSVDNGDYKCKACNYLGCTEHVYEVETLESLKSFEIKDATEYITTSENTTVKFDCSNFSNANIGGILWIKLKNNKKGVILKQQGDVYDIAIVSQRHEGIYGCVVNNSTIAKKFHLSVFKSPHFVKKMFKKIFKPAGNMIHLKCKAEGVPTPNISWYLRDKPPVRPLGDIKQHHFSMVIEDLRPEDSGHYKCVVCNFLGCIDFIYELSVVERYPSKPYIKDGFPRNLTVVVNDTAKFECPQLLADFEPYLQWTKLPLDFDFITNAHNISEHSGTILQQSFNSENSETFVIKNVTHEDEGWYVCIAKNSLGQSIAKGYLSVVDRIEEEKFICSF